MRLILICSILILGACAKKSADNPVTCGNIYAGAFMETYPDGVARKSEVALCSDGCNKVTDINVPPAPSFKMCSHP